jgi:hypothetical protein
MSDADDILRSYQQLQKLYRDTLRILRRCAESQEIIREMREAEKNKKMNPVPEKKPTKKQQAVLDMFDTAIKAGREYDEVQKRFAHSFHQAFKLAKKAGWTPSELFVEMARMETTGAQLQQARSEFAAFCRGEPDVRPKTDEWNGWL